MSTMHVAWITFAEVVDGGNRNIVKEVVAAENVTTSGVDAASGGCPQQARVALVRAVDANLYVTKNVAASAVTGVYVASGEQVPVQVESGDTIHGIQV